LAAREASAVRRFLPVFALCGSGLVADAAAQAPPAVDLWRVATTSIAVPAPLQTGATAMFWNPATVAGPPGLAVAAEAVITSETLGLSGLLGATSFNVPGRLRAGVVAGRVEIRDLVRTTTSPDGTDGSIPVYEQFVGLGIGLAHSWVQVGVSAAFHESRFDIESRSGLTFDAGLKVRPLARLTIAASTHLLPMDLSKAASTEYLAAAAYTVVEHVLDGMQISAIARYGFAYQAREAWEHIVGMGIDFDRRVILDLALGSESGIVGRLWRPSIGLGIRFGGYVVEFGHGLGANDIGGTTRVGLDVRFGT
jgi:hypothetical protein